MTTDKVINVGILLYPSCTLMDFAGAFQVFSAPVNNFTPHLIAQSTEITTSEGMTVKADFLITDNDMPVLDMLFIPGGSSNGVVPKMFDSAFLAFINDNVATWKGSVCTGAFILAASGILQNCTATTYWSVIPELRLLAEKYGLDIPDGYPRYLIDKEAKVFTGGGISSSIDLALDIVLKFQGLDTAQKTQLFIQYQPHPPVHAGDPEHAPEHITKDLLAFEQKGNEAYALAVEKLLHM